MNDTANFISKETINMLSNISLDDVAERLGHTLRRSGNNYALFCPNPNHGFEKTPDTMISLSKGLFKCFGGGGCGCRGNNAISFYSWHTYGSAEKEYFKDSVIGLAEIYGIPVKFENGKVIKNDSVQIVPKQRAVMDEVPAQPDEICNKVYRRYLSLCPLLEDHVKEWRKRRKYSDSEIQAFGLRSVPTSVEQANQIVRTLLEEGYNLDRIPGFSKALKVNGDPANEDDWYWIIGMQGKYYLPVRNELGLIVRLRVATGRTDGKAKYVWFSSDPTSPDEIKNSTVYSRDRLRIGGAPSGAVINVTVPSKLLKLWKPGDELSHYFDTSVAIVTEGEHKSTITANYTNQLVFGLPGAGNYQDLIPLAKRMQIKKLAIAIDTDAFVDKTKKQGKNVIVFQHLQNMVTLCIKEDIEVVLWCWNPEDGKGLDDSLLNGVLPIEIDILTDDRKVISLPYIG
ncbi:CHC2 zinc finger domain-containing protein [Paenibacillus sp. CFBP13512]|uniref:CHC2 zinc finger domain-containing protein n=1 Tax=Paenibacillus sp. CFBP13512 TaxID=2184007 RepID=UPI0013754432|nr:CHC2 zinc finger domain-containing protein [Paenibacillus sp. CFBP13512]